MNQANEGYSGLTILGLPVDARGLEPSSSRPGIVLVMTNVSLRAAFIRLYNPIPFQGFHHFFQAPTMTNAKFTLW
jgi:hypothetical protein